MQLWAQKQKGFTLVELLIVIVVIAVLAAISIVAYNGIQDRSKVSSINTSLSQVHKAVQSYNAMHGNYPTTGGSWVSQNAANKDTFIPGLVPDIISSIPRAEQWSGSPTFYYRSDGNAYKLLFLYPSTQSIPAAASRDSQVQSMLDPNRTTRGWGYWNAGGVSY